MASIFSSSASMLPSRQVLIDGPAYKLSAAGTLGPASPAKDSTDGAVQAFDLVLGQVEADSLHHECSSRRERDHWVLIEGRGPAPV